MGGRRRAGAGLRRRVLTGRILGGEFLRHGAADDGLQGVGVKVFDRAGDAAVGEEFEVGCGDQDGVGAAVLGDGDGMLEGLVLVAADVLLEFGGGDLRAGLLV